MATEYSNTSGGATSWAFKNIPLWFREGMAIANAGQQGQYPSLEDTTLWLSKHPDLDAFADGEALSKNQSAEVYGFALHAFEYLEERVGHEQVLAFINAMHDAPDFAAAFEPTLGLALADALRCAAVRDFTRKSYTFICFRTAVYVRAKRAKGSPPFRTKARWTDGQRRSSSATPGRGVSSRGLLANGASKSDEARLVGGGSVTEVMHLDRDVDEATVVRQEGFVVAR